MPLAVEPCTALYTELCRDGVVVAVLQSKLLANIVLDSFAPCRQGDFWLVDLIGKIQPICKSDLSISARLFRLHAGEPPQGYSFAAKYLAEFADLLYCEFG